MLTLSLSLCATVRQVSGVVQPRLTPKLNRALSCKRHPSPKPRGKGLHCISMTTVGDFVLEGALEAPEVRVVWV